MNNLLDILHSAAGNGKGASGTLVHFVMPVLFWFLLVVIIVREFLRINERKEYKLKMEEQRHRLEAVNSALEERISKVLADVTERDRFNSGQNELNRILRGEKSSTELADGILGFMIDYFSAGVGVFYLYDEKNRSLTVISTFAVSGAKRLEERVALGEGPAGQAAIQKKMIQLNDVPQSYLPIASALGEADPVNIVVTPVIHNGQLVGVLEIGSFKLFTQDMIEFLNQAMEGVAIAFSGNRSRELLGQLLEQTQTQAEELRIQQEELQQRNEELQERNQIIEQRRRKI